MDNKERKNYNSSLEYNGQAFADRFVLNCTGFKQGGYFLELGSRDPKINNNSYILEKTFNWQGIMVDRNPIHLMSYREKRPNSIPIIKDATKINYLETFQNNSYPLNLDFFQLDLEAISLLQ